MPRLKFVSTYRRLTTGYSTPTPFPEFELRQRQLPRRNWQQKSRAWFPSSSRHANFGQGMRIPANGLVQTAANATDSVRTVSVPLALLDTVQTTIWAPGVTRHTYTVWAAAGSVDTRLSYMFLCPSVLLEVDGAQIAQCRVPPDWVVEALDVIEHIGASCIA